MNKHDLEVYSFWWSEARLIFGAIALFVGGVPIALLALPGTFIIGVLKLCWIISGLASAYLLYHWVQNKRVLFGRRDSLDMLAFLISIVSGINLGITGLFGQNIGMSFFSNSLLFWVTGILYILAALHLYTQWKKAGRKLFK